MTQQPSDSLVDQLCELSGIPRDEAGRRLKGNNNDLQAALNELFDDPDSTKYKWVEDIFASDRDGTTSTALPSFQVHGPDDMDHSSRAYYKGAPSRPPSRTGNNSPYGVISLAAEHAAADPRTKLTEDEAGDHDLQRALALSAEESGVQQMGIIDEPTYGPTFGPAFGPANRPAYDDSQWAMVRQNTFAQEVLPDADAVDRKRQADEPAFLKPGVKETRLASVLTIYHEIPLAREILMNCGALASDYGYDAEWWTGKKIESSSTNRTGNEDTWDRASAQEIDDFLHEIHRLMAFLSFTDRAYGSADALVDMKALQLQNVPDATPDVESKFFEAWKEACQAKDQQPLISLLFTTAVQPSTAPRASPQEKRFAILDLDIPLPTGDERMETIYDLADAALWAMSSLEVESSAYLDTLAEVVAFRLSCSFDRSNIGGDSRIRIPATWYPDRYLKENREEALEMRKKQAAIKDELHNLRLRESKLTHFRLASGKAVKVTDLFATAMRHDANLVKNIKEDGSDQDNYPNNVSHQTSVIDLDISVELGNVLKSIDLKLAQLEAQKEAARDSLRELSKLYTTPPTISGTKPAHKYTLRGVSISKFITYIRRRDEANLISMNDDEDGSEDNDELAGSEQWWRLEYDTSSAKPVNVKKVTENEVMTDVYVNSGDVTVVYASEKAMQRRELRVPEALERFVYTDNQAFKAELAADQGHEMDMVEDESTSPRSPKRKFGESLEQGDGGGHGLDFLQARGNQERVPPPPEGPPPAYFPPATGSVNSDDKGSAVMGGFPSPPYNAGREKKGGDDGTAGKEMREMTTKGNVPRLISTMSMDIKEQTATRDDAMDVDDLASPELGSGKQ